jgi:hypothetical protein
MMTLTMGSRVGDAPVCSPDFRCDAQRYGILPSFANGLAWTAP